MSQPQVLICDAAGNAYDWTDCQEAVCYEARNKVIWRLGDVLTTFRGGRNEDGELSTIDVYPIIGCTSRLMGEAFFEKTSPHTVRQILYGRDRFQCAYCLRNDLPTYKLTIDHILPRSRGGKHTWMNTITACKPCNLRKGRRTPEEANMPLYFIPYIPVRNEKMILRNRNILADQQDFLMTKVPKTSRLWLDNN